MGDPGHLPLAVSVVDGVFGEDPGDLSLAVAESIQYLCRIDPMLDRDHEAILGHLSAQGIASSQDLQRATGKSQATVSRLLAELSNRIVTLGRARATRYGLPRLIRGLPAQQPITWTDEAGTPTQIGILTFLERELVHVDLFHGLQSVGNRLPWFLQPLKVQGFLGKVNAGRLVEAGLSPDPTAWNLESTLFAALRLNDPPGAITLGDHFAREDNVDQLTYALADDTGLPAVLDLLSSDVARHLPAGSSAGGEQPKFLAVLDGERHVLVKFTPPRDLPFGKRWHDLLHAEWLALDVLAQHGVPVAKARVIESRTRTYLVSERFDRLGLHGRRHVVAIGEAHEAFVPGTYDNWHATAQALARQGRLPPVEPDRIKALLEFGRLIGNTDMHSGNLALFVELDDLARGRFTTAPVYDMLPMRWRPNPVSGGWDDYVPFEPDERSRKGPAAGPAAVFWDRLLACDAVSTEMRSMAGRMLERIRA
jgi:hypothetical protein